MLLRDTIFLVARDPDVRADLRNIFDGQYNILEADSLDQANLLFRDNNGFIVAALLDMALVENEDISQFPWVHQAADTKLFPAVAIVSTEDTKGEHRAYEMGADEVIFRPIHPLSAERRVNNLVAHYRTRWALEEKVEEQTAALSHTNAAVVDTLASVIEYRSAESGMHTLRIRRFTQILLGEVATCCPEYELTEQSINYISSAAALHDLGKIAIPDAILNKPGRLTLEECAVMKGHSLAGSEMLANMGTLVDETYMRYAYNICRYHHERWDGNGYPEGLAGDQIPICAQVVGLADCYDALTTDRVYKSAYSCAEAANMIMNGECGIFSPVLLECFKSVRSRMEMVVREYADGFSPKNDAISTPLAPPIVTASDSLQRLMSKYSMLLRHIDGTVVDVDLEKETYHVAFYADPDLDFVTKTDEDVSAAHWRLNMFRPDGQEMTKDTALAILEQFVASGLRKREVDILMRGADGTLQPYLLTILRPETATSHKKLTLIYKNKASLADADPVQAGYPAQDGLLSLSQPCVYDRWLTMPTVGAELLRMTGYTETDIRERYHNRLAELIPEQEREQALNSLRLQLFGGNFCQTTFPLYRKSGKSIWVVAKGVLSEGADGEERIRFLLSDISGIRRELHDLRRSLARQELIVSQSNDVVFELDLISDRLSHYGKWEERFGYTPVSEQVMTNLERNSHFHPDDIHIFRKKIEQLRAGEPFVEMTARVVDSAGHYRWNRIRAALQRDDQDRPAKAVGVFIDIDNEQKAAWALQESARRDALTHLLNKAASQEEIKNYLARRKNDDLSVFAIIDLDNFKLLNDRYGHLFGDAVLSRVAAEIGRMFRGSDVVGRIGGDEFIVFLPEIPSEKMAIDRFNILCDSLRRLLGEYPVDGQLSCSIGIAFIPTHGLAYEDLFRRADRALYQSKSMGKGTCTVYSPSPETEAFPTTVSKRIDSDDQPGAANGSLAQYVFEKLYESGDTPGTIQSLLEMVGRQVGVSRVYIFENNEDNTTCSNTFEWCNEGITPEIENLQDISYENDLAGFRESFNEFGILYAPDITELSPQVRDIVEPQGIKSLLHCAIRDRGEFRGYVGFDDNNMIRLWTQEQIDLLTFLAQILSVFLLKHRIEERTLALTRELHHPPAENI